MGWIRKQLDAGQAERVIAALKRYRRFEAAAVSKTSTGPTSSIGCLLTPPPVAYPADRASKWRMKAMSWKLPLAFAACLPIALAACSGGGTPAPRDGPDEPPETLQDVEAAKTAAEAAVEAAGRKLTAAQTQAERDEATLERDAARAAVTSETARVSLETIRGQIRTAAQNAQQASTPEQRTAARTALISLQTRLAAALSGATSALQAARAALQADGASRAGASARTYAEGVQRRAQANLQSVRSANQQIADALRRVPERTEPVSDPSGNSGSYVQSRVQDLTVTHLEMTDAWLIEDEFDIGEFVCDRGTGCTGVGESESVGRLWEDLSGASDQSNGFALLRPDPINRVEVSFKTIDVVTASTDAVAPDTDGGAPAITAPVAASTHRPAVFATSTNIGGVGQYSGFFTSIAATRRSSTDRFVYAGGFSSAFGERHSGGRPSATATWRGAMVGQSRGSIGNGAQLAGEAVLTYSIADSTIDVALSQISSYGSVTYSGPRSFVWNDLEVNSDGTFHIPGYTNDRSGTRLHPTLGYIEGDFYGPNAEETAGVFERGSVQGAWLAITGN